MNLIRRVITAICIVAASGPGCADDPPGPDLEALRADEGLWARMLAAEDARGAGAETIGPLLEGLEHDEPVIRRIAVRALGRLERDSLASSITPLLDDSAPSVRAQAANALAQVTSPTSARTARSALQARVRSENEPGVLGVLAESIGRLPHGDSSEVAETVELLSGLAAREDTTAAGDSVRLGVVRGLYFLARQPAARNRIAQPGTGTLVRLATAAPDTTVSSSIEDVRVRTVATAALIATGAATLADLRAILADPDPFVRREAVAGLATMPGDAAAPIVAGALDDPSPVVRYEALRVDARVTAGQPCNAAVAALRDEDTHVALLAAGRLATGCGGPGATALLDSIASTLPPDDAPRTAAWHLPAQAVVTLAGLDPARAAPQIAALERSSNPFVRMRAAQAATLTGDASVLRRLASDSVPNVRTDAVTGLMRIEAHGADAVYIAQLRESDDSQLLRTAAAALAGSADTTAADALLDALDRMTERGRDTERDARVALIERLGELGDSTHAQRLAMRASDYDPRIADAAAEVVERWTGARPAVTVAATTDSLPTLEQLAGLDGARVTIEMTDGTRIEAALYPFDAPTNAWRFARLARAGYLEGLTFHRIAPNFVIQGGSPNANEYSGDGPFSRDELGLRYNWRGTIGLSTRGRDTGDGQIFINLIDNVRLDHEYTVFGEVTSDFEDVRRILEGDVIRRITIG